jgi:hypothetical protein
MNSIPVEFIPRIHDRRQGRLIGQHDIQVLFPNFRERRSQNLTPFLYRLLGPHVDRPALEALQLQLQAAAAVRPARDLRWKVASIIALTGALLLGAKHIYSAGRVPVQRSSAPDYARYQWNGFHRIAAPAQKTRYPDLANLTVWS